MVCCNFSLNFWIKFAVHRQLEEGMPKKTGDVTYGILLKQRLRKIENILRKVEGKRNRPGLCEERMYILARLGRYEECLCAGADASAAWKCLWLNHKARKEVRTWLVSIIVFSRLRSCVRGRSHTSDRGKNFPATNSRKRSGKETKFRQAGESRL